MEIIILLLRITPPPIRKYNQYGKCFLHTTSLNPRSSSWDVISISFLKLRKIELREIQPCAQGYAAETAPGWGPFCLALAAELLPVTTTSILFSREAGAQRRKSPGPYFQNKVHLALTSLKSGCQLLEKCPLLSTVYENT